MGLLGKITGAHKVKKQYQESLNSSYSLENQLLAELHAQQQSERSKIMTQRYAIELTKQKETERYQAVNSVVIKLHAEKEKSFELLCEKITDNMQLIRAALYACMTGETEILGILLKRDNTLRFYFFNLYPLHIAAEHNQTTVIKLLCEYGANVNKINLNNDLAIDLAETQGHTNVVKLLKQIMDASNALLMAAKTENVSKLQAVLEQGADINATDLEGYNALQLAIIDYQPYRTIVFLIEAGADFIHKDNKAGKNALVLAQTHPDPRIKAFILLAHGILPTDHAWLAELKNIPILNQLLGYEKIKEHLKLKAQGLALIDSPGHYYFNGADIVKMAVISSTLNGDYFDFSDNVQLQDQFIYYKPEHENLLKQEKGFAYLISQKTGHIAASQAGNLATCASTELAFYYENEVFRNLRAHFKLKEQARTLIDKEYLWFDGTSIISVQRSDLKDQRKNIDSGKFDLSNHDPRFQNKTISYKRELTKLLCGTYGFAYMESYKRQNTPLDLSYPLNIATDVPPEITFYYQNSVFCSHVQECLRLRKQISTSSSIHTRNFFNGVDIVQVDPEYTLNLIKQSIDSNLSLGEGLLCLGLISSTHRFCNVSQTVFFRPEHRALFHKLFAYGNGTETPHSGLKVTPLFASEDNMSYEEDLILQEHTDVQRGYSTAKALKASGANKTYRADYQERYRIGGYPNDAIGMQKFTDEEYGYETALGRDQNEITLINLYLYYLKNSYTYQAEGVRKYLKEFIVKKKNDIAKSEAKTVQDFLNKLSTMASLLLEAADNVNWQGVKECLLQGADINATDNEGFNALQRAIISKTPIKIEFIQNIIAAGIDLHHKTPMKETALVLAQRHNLDRIAYLLSEEPLMGTKRFVRTVQNEMELKACFQWYSAQAQHFLNKYSEDVVMCQAMFKYYFWLNEAEPYAIYAIPAMFMLNQLQEVLKACSIEKALKSAQNFFKKIRGIHCLVNQVGMMAATPFLATDIEFKDNDWAMVINSVQLKQHAFEVAKRLATNIQDERVRKEIFQSHSELHLQGVRSFICEFVVQVFGLGKTDFAVDKLKMLWLEQVTQYLTEQQKIAYQSLKLQLKNAMKKQEFVKVIHEAAQSDIIQLPSKQSLKNGLKGWYESHEEIQTQIKQGEIALEQEKTALRQWLSQREAEFIGYMTQLDTQIRALCAADEAMLQQYNNAYAELRTHFAQYRAEIESNYHSAKHRIVNGFIRNCVAIVAAVVIAAPIAPSLASSLGAAMGVSSASTLLTLEYMVQGTLIGSLSAGFSGNTNRILRDGFIGAWLAGFGEVMGGVLEKSGLFTKLNNLFPAGKTELLVGGEKITRGVITKSVVAGMRTAVQIGLEDGKLSTSLLCSIGSALALGSSKELPFVATMNEQLLSILVNSAVVSLATKSGLLENVARIGLGDLLQTTAQHLGNGLANLTAAERMRRKSVEVFKRNPTINKNIDKSLSPSTGFREHQERIKKARLEVKQIKYKHYREPLLNRSFKANDNIKRDKTKIFEQKEKSLLDAPLAQSKLTEVDQRKRVRRSFESVLEKASSFAAEGFISLLGVLSEEAHAGELSDNEKVLLFSVNSDHKKFFAGRFLPEKHNNRSDFWAARREVLEEKAVSQYKANIADKRPHSVFIRRDELNQKIKNKHCLHEIGDGPATGHREAAMVFGAIADLAQFSTELIVDLTNAAIIADELEQPFFRQDTVIREYLNHAQLVGGWHQFARIGENYVYGLGERLRHAQQEYAKGNYLTAGRLGNPLRPVIEVGTLGCGAVSGAKLIFSATGTAVKTSQGLFKQVNKLSKPTLWDRRVALDKFERGIYKKQLLEVGLRGSLRGQIVVEYDINGWPQRALPRHAKHKTPIPDPEAVGTWHTQLGIKESSRKKYIYRQAREFGPDNIPIKDIDFTDHMRQDHTNPHQHRYLPNKTGGTPERAKIGQPLDNSLDSAPESVKELFKEFFEECKSPKLDK